MGRGNKPDIVRKHAERFVKTVRTECLHHFVSFGERHLRHLVNEFIGRYLTERDHRGIASQIIRPKPSPTNDNATLGAITAARLCDAWRRVLGHYGVRNEVPSGR